MSKHFIVTFLAAIFVFSAQANAWTVAEGYEGGALGAQPSLHCRSNCKFTNEVVHSGKQAAKVSITKGSSGKYWGGSLNFPSSLTEGDEIWYRLYIYFPNGFDFSAGPVAKLMRIATTGYLSLTWSSSGSVSASNEVDSKTFTANNSNKNVGKLKRGVWQAFEMYVKISSKAGQGAFRVWRDGNLVFEDKKTPNIASGDKSAKALFGTYWNGGAPRSQSMYVDDIVWTTERPSSKDAKGNYFIGLGKGNSTTSSEPKQPDSPPKPPIVR